MKYGHIHRPLLPSGDLFPPFKIFSPFSYPPYISSSSSRFRSLAFFCSQANFPLNKPRTFSGCSSSQDLGVSHHTICDLWSPWQCFSVLLQRMQYAIQIHHFFEFETFLLSSFSNKIVRDFFAVMSSIIAQMLVRYWIFSGRDIARQVSVCFSSVRATFVALIWPSRSLISARWDVIESKLLNCKEWYYLFSRMGSPSLLGGDRIVKWWGIWKSFSKPEANRCCLAVVLTMEVNESVELICPFVHSVRCWLLKLAGLDWTYFHSLCSRSKARMSMNRLIQLVSVSL